MQAASYTTSSGKHTRYLYDGLVFSDDKTLLSYLTEEKQFTPAVATGIRDQLLLYPVQYREWQKISRGVPCQAK